MFFSSENDFFNSLLRNKRLPNDPVNALLSLAYSLLTKDCTIAVLSVGFDPYVGFMHKPRFGKSDLASRYHGRISSHIIADSIVITAINNKIFTKKDFVQAGKVIISQPRE